MRTIASDTTRAANSWQKTRLFCSSHRVRLSVKRFDFCASKLVIPSIIGHCEHSQCLPLYSSLPLCYRRAMANEEQLARLKQGVDHWNAWRHENNSLILRGDSHRQR